MAPRLLLHTVSLLFDASPRVSSAAGSFLQSYLPSLPPAHWWRVREQLEARAAQSLLALPHVARTEPEVALEAALRRLSALVVLLHDRVQFVLAPMLPRVALALAQVVDMEASTPLLALTHSSSSSAASGSADAGGAMSELVMVSKQQRHTTQQSKRQHKQQHSGALYYGAPFRYITQQSTVAAARRMLRLLGRLGDAFALLRALTRVAGRRQWRMHHAGAVWACNQVLHGKAGAGAGGGGGAGAEDRVMAVVTQLQRGSASGLAAPAAASAQQCVQFVMEQYMGPSLWNLPTVATEAATTPWPAQRRRRPFVSIKEAHGNALVVAQLLEGIGLCAECLGGRAFQLKLVHTLYPLLAKLGDPAERVRQVRRDACGGVCEGDLSLTRPKRCCCAGCPSHAASRRRVHRW